MRHQGIGSRATVELSSADASWRLKAHIPEPARWKPNTLAHLQRVPLVSLTVDEALFDALIQSPVLLPRLRELSVVFSEPALSPCISAQHDWDSLIDTVHAVLLVSLSITWALELLLPFERVLSAPVARLVEFGLYLCVLAAVVYVQRLHHNGQRGDLTCVKLSCPALDCITLCAGKGARPVLCVERMAPVLELLAHSAVRPSVMLAGGVKLDVQAIFRVMWLTYRIPVSA